MPTPNPSSGQNRPNKSLPKSAARVAPSKPSRNGIKSQTQYTSAQTQTDDFTQSSLLGLTRLDPAVHDPQDAPSRFPWMPGTRPGKTIMLRLNDRNASEH